MDNRYKLGITKSNHYRLVERVNIIKGILGSKSDSGFHISRTCLWRMTVCGSVLNAAESSRIPAKTTPAAMKNDGA